MRATRWMVMTLAVLLVAGVALAQGGRTFRTSLTGAAERPGPGDPDGQGTAELRLNPGKDQICYTITVTAVDSVTAAHIHRGPSDVAGPVVVTLNAPVHGSSSGCVEVSRDLIHSIMRDPSQFYLNVHTVGYPAGAMRGQLATH